LTEHVTPKRKLRLSWVLRFLQEAAIGGVSKIGYPHEKTLDRGLLWVVGKQRIEIARLPEYDETIRISTYPGKKFFRFFQRHTYIETPEGESLIKANAVWTLIDYKTRKMVDAEQYGINIPEESKEGELRFPAPYPVPPLAKKTATRAKWSECDINGHINNCAYLDIAEDLIPVSFLMEKSPLAIDITYKKEVLLDEEIEISYDLVGDEWYFESDHFSIRIKYA